MTKPLRFTKMHGLGNDFLMLDLINQSVELTPEKIQSWADRHRGVGFDQMLCIYPSTKPNVDFFYRIFNANGTEAEQCGNGARCVARFLSDLGLITKKTVVAETIRSLVELKLQDDGQVCVNMGIPCFNPDEIPFKASAIALQYPLSLLDATVSIHAVSMGNPHAVLRVDSVEDAPVQRWGSLIERHERFPNATNVGFMQIVGNDHIKLRVFERGAGETLACGTGACAAMVSAHQMNWVGSRVSVELPGGTLIIEWQGPGYPVWMTGPAVTVYRGEF